MINNWVLKRGDSEYFVRFFLRLWWQSLKPFRRDRSPLKDLREQGGWWEIKGLQRYPEGRTNRALKVITEIYYSFQRENKGQMCNKEKARKNMIKMRTVTPTTRNHLTACVWAGCGHDFGSEEAISLQQVNNRLVLTCREEAASCSVALGWEVWEKSPRAW